MWGFLSLGQLHVGALSSFAYLSACVATLAAAPSLGAESEEALLKPSEALHLNEDYSTWQTRRYLEDERPFLVKFKEVAAEMEVFPFQWLVYPGTKAADLQDSTFGNKEDAQRFYHFVDIARTATKADLEVCLDNVPDATPKERALLLVVLHTSLDDEFLPTIAEYIDDYSVAFPQLFSAEGEAWRKERAFDWIGERIRLGEAVRAKSDTSSDLDCFEKRVLGSIAKFQLTGIAGTRCKSTNGMFELRCVSHYALAILNLRGCGLVEPMREMSRFRGRTPPVSYMGGYAAPLSVERVFTEEAWNEFQAMSFDVRRLHLEYILQVECVPPPYQEDAVAAFMKRLENLPPRTIALACFSISTSVLNELRNDRVLIPDWHEYVHRIPKEQIEELLTSPNLDAIDADLTFEPQLEHFLGFRPYFSRFLVYVLRHRSEWFDDAEFAEIEPRLSRPAKSAWKTLKRTEDSP